MGRLLAALTIFSALQLSAGTIWTNTTDGVGYNWWWDQGPTNYGTIQVQFSALVSDYQFEVALPYGVTNPTVRVDLPDAGSVKWAAVNPYLSVGPFAMVTGTLPGISSVNISLGADASPSTIVFPVSFRFSKLVDPPAGAADAPEPTTWWLALLPVFGILWRKAHGRYGRLFDRDGRGCFWA